MELINLKLGDIKDSLPKDILGEFCKEGFNKVEFYPMDYSELIEILATKHNLRKEDIVLINGVDEGIELISRAFKGDILIFTPSYYEFRDAPKRNGFKFSEIDCFNNFGYSLNYKEEDIKNRSLIFLCNPNNPFGLLSKEEITNLCIRTKGIVAVDETYIDFNGESMVKYLKKLKNLLILRSFSKAYSVAGLRIGYIIGDAELIKKIKAIKLYCNVTSVSVNCAKILLKKEAYFKKLRQDINLRKDNFENFLKNIDFSIIHTHTNNIIIKFRETKEANNFFEFLKQNYILVNQGDGVSACGLDNTFIRFSCGTQEQMQKVKNIIESYKSKKK
jgi:histidinol-phosphate/aromatic aminotransferase/cobyric acid decarboxylase-like protein